MAKIYAPNKQYTGVSASVPFVNGVGETDDRHLIAWFEAHGYTVEQEPAGEKPVDDMTVAELKELAKTLGVELTTEDKKADILAKVKAAQAKASTGDNPGGENKNDNGGGK